MKILWLVNIPLPEASKLMGEIPSPFGGWLTNASKDLANKEGVKLSIAFPRKMASNFEKLEGEKIAYYTFVPVKDSDKEVIKYNESFSKLLRNIKPDIVHIHGTELPQTLSMINTCKEHRVETIISIQGLVSIIEKHVFSNLPTSVIYGRTLRDLVKNDSVNSLRKIYVSRGTNEVESIKNTNHVIGRTTWDKACSLQINPKVNYHFCNETLRGEFYKDTWNMEKCEKYSIFISQGQNPIKGLHNVIEALPIILKSFPEAKVYVSGPNITKSENLKNKLLMTYYGKHIKNRIKKLNLVNNIFFTGVLNEKEMCQRFLKSHVFVSASSIENESNSVSEAKILGVPVVSSYVGGVTDRISHNEDGFLYQHDAPYMLAHYVIEIFKNEDIAQKFSKNSRQNALKIHDQNENTRRILAIYENVLNNTSNN